MRYTTTAESDEILGFARRAAEHFLANPQHETFTDGEIEGGALFGVRWGANRAAAHAVLVLRIDEGFEPIIVGDLDHDRRVAEMAAEPARCTARAGAHRCIKPAGHVGSEPDHRSDLGAFSWLDKKCPAV